MSSGPQAIRAPAAAARALPGGPDSVSNPLLSDPEAGVSSTVVSSAKPSKAARAAQEDTEATRGRNRWKLILYALAALACGVLTFNFHYIIQVSHIHLSLAHSHRTSAFCAFVGCKLHEAQADAAPAPYQAPTETVTAMMVRVCGQPAVDGYSHVVPKCLEDSPTAKWWDAYYKAGGNQSDLIVHIDPQADYDGLAVFWGIGNKKKSVEECAAHCLRHMPNQVGGPYEKLPCNAFAFCPFDVCFEPDAHKHTKGDCWLKFTEGPAHPEVNMRGVLPESFRRRHATAPNVTPWMSGVLLPRGVALTNGTWSPRYYW